MLDNIHQLITRVCFRRLIHQSLAQTNIRIGFGLLLYAYDSINPQPLKVLNNTFNAVFGRQRGGIIAYIGVVNIKPLFAVHLLTHCVQVGVEPKKRWGPLTIRQRTASNIRVKTNYERWRKRIAVIDMKSLRSSNRNFRNNPQPAVWVYYEGRVCLGI